MTPLKLFGRIETYYLCLPKIYKSLRKHQSLHKHNTTYLYATCLSLSRFFHPATEKADKELQSQASEKAALKRMEDLQW